jgi:hypothetical protein
MDKAASSFKFSSSIIDMNGTTDYLEIFAYRYVIQAHLLAQSGGSTELHYFGAFRIGDNYDTTFSTKIKLYANQEIDFTKDVIFKTIADGKGAYIS